MHQAFAAVLTRCHKVNATYSPASDEAQLGMTLLICMHAAPYMLGACCMLAKPLLLQLESPAVVSNHATGGPLADTVNGDRVDLMTLNLTWWLAGPLCAQTLGCLEVKLRCPGAAEHCSIGGKICFSHHLWAVVGCRAARSAPPLTTQGVPDGICWTNSGVTSQD